MLSKGVEIRAQIDADSAKGLLLISGGASIALLAFLPHVIDKPRFETLAYAIVYGLLFYQASLVLAVLHNIYRRRCSLVFESAEMRPLPGTIFGIRLRKPTVCFISQLFLWSSLLAFLVASIVVFCGALDSLAPTNAAQSSAPTNSYFRAIKMYVLGIEIWELAITFAYVFTIVGSALMVVFAMRFPFSTSLRDLVHLKERFLWMNGYTVWLLAWALIIFGSLIHFINFKLGY